MARLRVSDNGVDFDVYLDDKLRVRVGRADECEITLEDTQASRLHAEVTLTDAGFVLQDRDSANGTAVNGRPVKQHPLRDGDEIRIGAARMRFSDPDQAERLRQAAANGAVPVPAAVAVPAPTPERRPAAGSGRSRAPSGRHRASGRAAVRRRGGLDGLLVGGGVLGIGLLVAVVALAGARRDVSREAQTVLDQAKALAGKRRYREAVEHLGRMPANAPPAVVERARGLQREWERVPAAPVQEASADPAPAAAPAPAPADRGSDGAFDALRQADATAIPAAGAGRFGAALAAYGPVIERFSESDAAEQARARREKILDDAAALWTSRHERAITLARARQFDAARAIYQQVIDEWGLPEFVKLAQDRLDYVNDLATH